METSSQLAQKHCKPCEGKMPAMTESQIQSMLPQVPGWSYENGQLVRSFGFKNYYETVSFVNAAAWIAHREDHHPDMSFGYKNCKIAYSTHAVKGISENDFVCAAKINELIK